MQHFAALYQALDASTSTRAKRQAIVQHLRATPDADAAWIVYFLAGGKPRQCVPTAVLRALAQAASGLPQWLVEESYHTVGDLAETIALLLPPPRQPTERPLSEWLSEHLLPLRGQSRQAQLAALLAMADTVPHSQRLVWGKLLTGALRVGVARPLLTQALAELSGLPAPLLAQRLMGATQADRRPTAQDHRALLAPLPQPVHPVPATAAPDAAPSAAATAHLPGQPYPFFLAHPWAASADELPQRLGPSAHWLVEWKWDGIRAQLVRRNGQAWLWSRGEELLTERFPELAALAAHLPEGTVLDGEILIWLPGREQPEPFAALQRRTTRLHPAPKLLRQSPALLMAYDLLEHHGADLRGLPLAQRRQRLCALVEPLGHPNLRTSPSLPAADWPAVEAWRERARSLGAEGLMLKAQASTYGVGRTQSNGQWWKWKLDPYRIDAVLVYAQRGHGRRASLYSDYTFAVWSGPPQDPQRQLVPFAKAYSGLTDAEMAQVDALIRRSTLQQFGPVRAVEPRLVFELGFEAIARSSRHKSGVAVRFPRMLRWRTDKPAAEADTLQTLMALLDSAAPTPEDAQPLGSPAH